MRTERGIGINSFKLTLSIFKILSHIITSSSHKSVNITANPPSYSHSKYIDKLVNTLFKSVPYLLTLSLFTQYNIVLKIDKSFVKGKTSNDSHANTIKPYKFN